MADEVPQRPCGLRMQPKKADFRDPLPCFSPESGYSSAGWPTVSGTSRMLLEAELQGQLEVMFGDLGKVCIHS